MLVLYATGKASKVGGCAASDSDLVCSSSMPPFPDIDIYLGYWLRTFSVSVNGGTMSIVMYLVMETGRTR
jgi:hypothetical protein